MAMNATQIALNVRGVNSTGKVFAQIASTAARVGKTVALIGGASFAGMAAAFAATANKLGALSDVAMRAGATTDELTKLSTALGVLGVQASTPEQLATAFQKMAKTTGETGVAGFKKCIAAISEMETVEERSAAAMATFGRSGMTFLPLIEAAAKNGVGALNDVIEAMPGVSQAAADAGDSVADAMSIMTQGAKSLWYDAIGAIAGWLDGKFAGGVREASLKAVAYVEYWSKRALLTVEVLFINIGRVYKTFSSDFITNLASLGRAVEWAAESIARYIGDQFLRLGRMAGEMMAAGWRMAIGKEIEGDDSLAALWKRTDNGAGEQLAARLRGAAEMVGDIFSETSFVQADFDDLEETLQEKVAAAVKGAAAVSAAAVSVASSDAAAETEEKVRDAVAKSRADLIESSSYRAATMSLRADYGRGESKQVAALNSIKLINQKIADASKRTADAFDELGVA